MNKLTPQEIVLLQRQANLQTKYDFRVFVKRAFHVLDEGTPLEWNWHLDYLCSEATKMVALWLPQEALDIARLTKEDHQRRSIVNIPPRSMKSVIFSVCLKAWLIGHNPAMRTMGASYSAKLAKGFNRDILRVISCDWYKQVFPEVEMSKTSEPEMETTKNGKLQATSTGGTATGMGGNFNTADDLLDPEKARSDADRLFSNSWMSGTYMSRLNDKKNGSVAVIMQRLHEDDTTGMLIETTKHLPDGHPFKWVLVKVPSICQETFTYKYYGTSHTFEEGEILHENRQDKENLDAELATMGDLKFAGQYLQEPTPMDGSILDPKKLRYYSSLPKLDPENEGVYRIIQSWDTAIKILAHHDFTVCTTWLECPEGYFLIDMLRGKWEYSALKEKVKEQYYKFNPNIVLMEDKGSGQQLFQDFTAPNDQAADLTNEQKLALPIIGIKPHTDKITRAMGIEPLLNAGRIFVPSHPSFEMYPPKDAAWYQELVAELAMFPNSRHDDIIDTISQMVNWSRDTALVMPRVRCL